MNEPNPSVVRAIWERVTEWALESGRLPVDGGQSSVDSGRWTVDGGQCPKCNNEIHIHPRGAKCGCTVCKAVFEYPSMTEITVEYGQVL